MVIRDFSGIQISPLLQEVVEHNLSVFRGERQLGGDFELAIERSAPYAGAYYIESLVDTVSGRIVEILLPDPKRSYEREVIGRDGKRSMVPLCLSTKNPAARLAVFIVSAKDTSEIFDVIARDEISPDARATLYESARMSALEPIRAVA